MHWKEYQTLIVEKHRVHLVGWPEEMPFNIKNLGENELIVLLKALTDATCRWERVPLADISASLAAKDNEPPRKKRVRKRKASSIGESDTLQPKTSRIVSSEVVNDDDDIDTAAAMTSQP